MRKKVDTPDAEIAALAERQHGVVSRRQLVKAGIDDAATFRRVESGRLHRVHRGVYAVGHRPRTFESRCMGAVLACGEGALVSRHSAAALWRLLDPQDGEIHVSVPGRHGRAEQDGIRLHRCPSLTAEQATRKLGIPVTTPPRTIADLRREVTAATWRRAVRQAEVLGLRTGLEERSVPTRSELEDRFLQLCRRHRLPMPEVNVRIGSLEVDFLWRERRLVVETDGYRYHRGPAAFEGDHTRDFELRSAGYDILRLTYDQVTTTPERTAGLVRTELERTRPN